jgi:hypothetical protein
MMVQLVKLDDGCINSGCLELVIVPKPGDASDKANI